MQENLINYTKDILKYIQEIPLSDNTVKYYHSCYQSLIYFCENNGYEFSSQVAEDFLEYENTRYSKNEIGKIYYLTLRKAIYTLINYVDTGNITWNRLQYNRVMLCDCFSTVLTEFEQSLVSNSLSRGSIKLLIQMITRFLSFLESKKIYELRNIELNHVKEFIIELSPKFKANMINLTWPIKKFFAFLNAKTYSNLNVTNILANPIKKRKKVLPCFSQEDLTTMFSAIDTCTSLGKRDYAITKLSIGTGLRIVDIANLCFSNVDWRTNEIKVTQEKTRKQLILPLSADVGNAIADYILNGRPKSNSSYIFLKHRRPYEKLDKGVGANTIKRCLSNAEIVHVVGDGKTFHGLRRTFGTELVKAKTPLPTVSQLLGHSSLNTSKHYISLNDDMLRVCCMDISMYSTTKEGLL